MKHDQTIDHEVRIRLLERMADKFDATCLRLEEKIDSNFHWTLGTMITLFIAGMTIFLTLR